MKVIGASRSGRAVPSVDRASRVAQLHRALALADFVALVVPLTPVTRGLIDARALAAMRASAWLLNISRGALVDETALADAAHATHRRRCARRLSEGAAPSSIRCGDSTTR